MFPGAGHRLGALFGAKLAPTIARLATTHALALMGPAGDTFPGLVPGRTMPVLPTVTISRAKSQYALIPIECMSVHCSVYHGKLCML